MKKSKRRNYTDEFKEEAVKLVTEQHYKITAIPDIAPRPLKMGDQGE